MYYRAYDTLAYHFHHVLNVKLIAGMYALTRHFRGKVGCVWRVVVDTAEKKTRNGENVFVGNVFATRMKAIPVTACAVCVCTFTGT